MAYEMVMPYHLHMPSYFLETFTEYPNLVESIFIRCFLAFWRSKGMIDHIGVGGSGGHCAPSYFHLIETPLFSTDKQKEIAVLYHNPNCIYNNKEFTAQLHKSVAI